MTKINELRLVPKDTEVWSVLIQENIKFCNDVVISIKHTMHGSDGIFAFVQHISGNIPG